MPFVFLVDTSASTAAATTINAPDTNSRSYDVVEKGRNVILSSFES